MGEHKHPKLKLFLALPNYGFQRHNTVQLLRAFIGPSPFAEVFPEEQCLSLLAYAFNTLWVHALAERKNGVTHFLMLHADCVPWSDGWLTLLFQEMERVGAQVLSGVSPLKDWKGLTSTAIDGMPLRRLTMTEILARPETFSDPDLLVNTGMLLVDMRAPWVEQICFTIKDRIDKNADGSHSVVCEPEDWSFSRQARRLGVKLWATRKVHLVHIGLGVFPNFAQWGTEANDHGSGAAHQEPLVAAGMCPLLNYQPANPRGAARDPYARDPTMRTPSMLAELRALGPDPAPRSTKPPMSPHTDSTNATQAHGQGGNPWPWRPSERKNREQPDRTILAPSRQSAAPGPPAPRHPSSAPDPGVAS